MHIEPEGKVMFKHPDDIFAEPDADPDTLGNLGPLRALAGVCSTEFAADMDAAVAAAARIARHGDLVLLSPACASLDMFRDYAQRGEAFADRRYEPDGTLRSRKLEDALIRDPEMAARQALGMVERGLVTASDGSQVALAPQTICIHGDTPGATKIAAEVARALSGAGIKLAGLLEK